MDPLPKGIQQITILMLIASTLILAFGLLGIGFINFGANNGTPYALNLQLITYAMVAVAISGILLSFYISKGHSSKRLWRSLIAHWMLLLFVWLTWDFSHQNFWITLTENPNFSSYFLSFGPIVYAIYCTVCFLTSGPRQYFHSSIEQPIISMKNQGK